MLMPPLSRDVAAAHDAELRAEARLVAQRQAARRALRARRARRR